LINISEISIFYEKATYQSVFNDEMTLDLTVEIKDMVRFSFRNKKQLFINTHDLCSSTSSLQVCQWNIWTL